MPQKRWRQLKRVPDYFYYFHAHPKSRFWKYLVLVDPITGNAQGFTVKKLRHRKEAS